MSKKIRLMLVHTNELFRKSLAALLNTNPAFEVIAELPDGKTLMDQLKQSETDIVFMDTHLEGMDAKSALDVMQLRFADVKCIMLSMSGSHFQSTEFMSRGAACYLSMDSCSVDMLFKATKTVHYEGHYFDNSISKAMLGALLRNKKEGDPGMAFNDRELEVMIAVCDGKTNKEIAASLHLSSSTIDFYKARIYEKTACNNAAGLVKYAIRKGIITLS